MDRTFTNDIQEMSEICALKIQSSKARNLDILKYEYSCACSVVQQHVSSIPWTGRLQMTSIKKTFKMKDAKWYVHALLGVLSVSCPTRALNV